MFGGFLVSGWFLRCWCRGLTAYSLGFMFFAGLGVQALRVWCVVALKQ